MSLINEYTKEELEVMKERAVKLLEYYKDPLSNPEVKKCCPLCYENHRANSCRKCIWNLNKEQNFYYRCRDSIEEGRREIISLRKNPTEEWRNKRIKKLTSQIKEIEERLKDE